jgi:membrane protein
MANDDHRHLTAAEGARISIWRLGGLQWRELLRRVWHELYEGGLLTHAAALAFYFFFAIFPLLLILATLMEYFGEVGGKLQSSLLKFLGEIAPPSAFTLVTTTIGEFHSSAIGLKFWLGLGSALWLASLGIAALSESLNVMYGVHETRRWLHVRLSAISLTAVLMTLIVFALLLILYGGEIGVGVAEYFQRGQLFATLWTLGQVPMAIIFALLAFAMIYYFAPDLKQQKWYWITPGSLVGVALWIGVSSLFRIYLRHFDMYSNNYGSLGAVVVLLLWFYLSGAAILLGGKINAEIENAAAMAGAPDAKLRGEKAPDDHDDPGIDPTA